MPPKFREAGFAFSKPEDIPAHIEEDPSIETRNPHKFSVEGVTAPEQTTYPVADDIDDLATALIISRARRRQVELTQAGKTKPDTVRVVYPQYKGPN